MPKTPFYFLLLAAVGLFVLFTYESFGESIFFPFFSLVGGAIERNLFLVAILLLLAGAFYFLDRRGFRR